MSLFEETSYDHSEAERTWAEYWRSHDIYRYDPQSVKPTFSVDTPPPYASAAHLHAGHAMSYTQAEIIIRQRRMLGYNIFYPMGFDDNGLSTERYVEHKYGVSKSNSSRRDFIDLCLSETRAISRTYREFWEMLGLSVDWTLQYSTISPDAIRIAQSSFRDLWVRGLAVRKEEPVMWDTAMTTTLAQADTEIVERQGVLYDLAFTLDNGESVTIATTRPELLPACVALFRHPEDPRYSHLEGRQAVVPVFGQSVPILADPSVSTDFGTGMMMVCTFGDSEDLAKWRRHRLPMRIVLQEDGRLNLLADEYKSQRIKAARRNIVESLREQGHVCKEETLTQRVVVAERSKTPVEFIPKLQWFVKLVDFAHEFSAQGDKLNWFPRFHKARFDDWVEGLRWDWCISRQRFYGVPIPVWYCSECGDPVVATPAELPVAPTSHPPSVGACEKCGSHSFVPDSDVFDTWMTSSLTPMINAGFVLNDDGSWHTERPIYPMSVRVQGFEIIRTWLFYTIAKAFYHTGVLPFDDVIVSGWGLDPKGKKISKSAGNYQSPIEIVSHYSADALRYWAALGTLGGDLCYSEAELKKGRRLQIKLFNAARFLAMSLGENYKHSDEPADLLPIDHWLLGRCNEIITECTKLFGSYDYSNALRAIEAFFWIDLCDNALEMMKARIRLAASSDCSYSDNEIRSGQHSTFAALFACVRMLAPFIPFVTEHVYQGFFRQALTENPPISVHVSAWPKPFENLDGSYLEHGKTVVRVCHQLRKAKTQRIEHGTAIGGAVVTAPADVLRSCELFRREITSAIRVPFLKLAEGSELSVELEETDQSSL